MNLKHKMKSRDAKSNPVTAVLAAVFVMFIVSGLLLLLLAMLLYKMELEESAVRIGIIAIYVVAGIAGGFLMGKIMREQKYLWGLAAGAIYFVLCRVRRGKRRIRSGYDAGSHNHDSVRGIRHGGRNDQLTALS